MIRNRAGRDRVVATARNLRTGERCRATHGSEMDARVKRRFAVRVISGHGGGAGAGRPGAWVNDDSSL